MLGGMGNSTYYVHLENIQTAAFTVIDSALTFAATKEKNMNESAEKPRDEFTVLGDGTWKKRGFTSLFGWKIHRKSFRWNGYKQFLRWM